MTALSLTGQRKVREIQGHGILEFVREIWNSVKSQGNSGKSYPGQGKLTFSIHTHIVNIVHMHAKCSTRKIRKIINFVHFNTFIRSGKNESKSGNFEILLEWQP